MKKEQLSDAIGKIDEDILTETLAARAVPVGRRWRTWVAVAACLCVLAGCLLALPFLPWQGEENMVVSDPASSTNSTVTTSVDGESHATENSTTPAVSDTTASVTTTAKTTAKTTVKTTTKPPATSTTTRSRYPFTTTQRTVQSVTGKAPRPTVGNDLLVGAPSSVANLLVAPIYPKMVARPQGDDWEAERLWEQSVKTQREQIIGEAKGMTHFYASTIKTFLAGDPGENRVYSPLNVYMALAMLAETAEGNSRAQILDLLNVSDVSILREKCGNIWNGVYNDDGVTACRLGNSLWLAEGERWDYDTETARLLADYYYASTYKGVMGSESYDKAIQDWLNQQTGGLLKEQAGNISFNPDTALALASTVYFKANWYNEFSKKSTYKRVFHAATGDVTTDFMRGGGIQTAYFGNQYTAVCKSFEDYNYDMWFILPNAGVSVDTLIEDQQLLYMLEDPLSSGIGKRNVWVRMHIPKFDVTSDKSLIEGLKALGVTDVFNSRVSDFSGILSPGNEPIAVTSLKHAARVTIDEEGVEAAAFTVSMAGAESSPDISMELDFIADRPFMFAITGPENVLLFTGVVETPQ